MSAERLFQIHEVLKEPLRQKILLQLGQNESLTMDELTRKLKIQDSQEISSQLGILETFTVEGEHLLSKQSDEQYILTEKGHYVLDKLIVFPDLKSDDYKKRLFGNVEQPVKSTKPKPKWFTPYWIALCVIAAVIMMYSILSNQYDDLVLIDFVVLLLIAGFAYYVRIKPLSKSKMRIVYIVLFGNFFGFVFSFAYLFVCVFIDENWDAFTISLFASFFIIGGILGDIIGRKRNYKGPAQYSP
jgi:hypothetical protein